MVARRKRSPLHKIPDRLKDVPIDLRITPNAPLPPAALMMAVLEHGPKCAAWLVSTMRWRLHEYGWFRCHMEGDNPPPWFMVAIRTLEMRPRVWDVTREPNNRYLVKWRGWMRSTAPTPLVFVNGGTA